MKTIEIKKFEIRENFSVHQFKTLINNSVEKADLERMLLEKKEKLRTLQDRFYANGSQSLLIILQAMDAAGKDSFIKHVFGGVNPQGCRVTSFKTPSTSEYDHDFLWRHYLTLPKRGEIGIFNRSHYENVLVCKVHPDYILREKTWSSVEDFDDDFWDKRYESILNFEKHLYNNGTKIVKIFLNISKEEQRKRFLDRINTPEKNWKFSSSDMKERELWAEYMKAYEEAINKTSKKNAPWYVVPADQKGPARLIALEIIIQSLKKMDLSYPKPSPEKSQMFSDAKNELEKE